MNNTVNYHSVTTPGKLRIKNNVKRIASGFSVANISAAYITAIMMAVFSVTAVLLCALNIQIYQLNNEIAALEEEYSNVMTLNDELSGRILARSNLGEVEKYATETLGMRKPGTKDYEYVSYTAPVMEEVVVTEDGGFFDGIRELFGI